MGMRYTFRNKYQAILIIIGLLFLISGIVLLFTLPHYLNKLVAKEFIIEKQSQSFSEWSKPSAPMFFDVYFLNVTNFEEALAGKKPLFEEIGPYVYLETHEKIIKDWFFEKGVVRFAVKKHFYYKPNKGRSQEDLIATVNAPLLILNMMIENNTVSGGMLMKMLPEKLFVKKTVRELLFDGYNVDFLAFKENVKSFLSGNKSRSKKFSYFAKKNGSEDIFSVYTGKKGIERYTHIVTYQESLRHWNSSLCNQINGTDGRQFPFPVTPESQLAIFSPTLCRSVSLEFEREVNIDGIRALRFSVPPDIFSRNPCPNPDGVLPLTACRSVPAVLSGPHFLGANSKFRQKVLGLKEPNIDQHGSFVDVEPRTGLTLQARRRVMLNWEVHPSKELLYLQKAPNALFPAFWSEKRSRILSLVADRLKSRVLTPLSIADASPKVVILIGVALMILAFLLSLRFGQRGETKFISEGGAQTNTINYNVSVPVSLSI